MPNTYVSRSKTRARLVWLAKHLTHRGHVYFIPSGKVRRRYYVACA